MDSRLSFHGSFQQREFIADNVVGLLEGSDPELKNSFLLVSAHYDHLGIGPAVNGDRIYNGAFDNAIGVSLLLELARNWSQSSSKRSVLFLFTTGEEKGLLGSSYYVRHPLVLLYRTLAAVNIDGVAVFDTFNDVIGLGSEFSQLSSLLKRVAARQDLSVVNLSTSIRHAEAFSRSDQITFAEAGIPSVLLLEGLSFRHMSHSDALQRINRWGRKFYHSPFDDLNQEICWEAAFQHFQLIYSFCRELGDIEEEVEWFQGTPYIHARLQSKAERR
jgi:Zn-dependent M28 family amino/carboxypeptidase